MFRERKFKKKKLEKKIKRSMNNIQKNMTVITEIHRDLSKHLMVFLTAGMAWVCASFWQTAITDTIKAFVPISGVWTYEVIVAGIVTVLCAVIVLVAWKSKLINGELGK